MHPFYLVQEVCTSFHIAVALAPFHRIWYHPFLWLPEDLEDLKSFHCDSRRESFHWNHFIVTVAVPLFQKIRIRGDPVSLSFSQQILMSFQQIRYFGSPRRILARASFRFRDDFMPSDFIRPFHDTSQTLCTRNRFTAEGLAASCWPNIAGEIEEWRDLPSSLNEKCWKVCFALLHQKCV